VQQPQRPKQKKKQANRAGIVIAAAAIAAAAAGAGPQAAGAYVPPPTPSPRASTPANTPAISPNATVLPLDSSLFFVLDGTISSRLTAGTIVRAHLRDPIVLDHKTIAPAGTAVDIEISQADRAHMGNEDGSVDIYFKALRLPGGQTLPLMTPTGHIDPHVTVGQYNTRAVTDTIGDIFIPGHYLYHMLRKGHDVTLGPGTVLRARTGAELSVAKGTVVVAAPAPLVTAGDTPHAAFSPAPMYTPPGFVLPTPKPSPSITPTSTP
jgi:hypothetical protein